MDIHINKNQGTSGVSPDPKRFKDLHQYDIEVFVCENIQNILDNSLDNEKPVKVIYQIDKLSSEETQLLKSEIDQEVLFKKLKKSFEESSSQDVRALKNKVLQSIKRKEWISLKIYEENTTGLIGSENPKKGDKSPFNALMRAVNTTEKKVSNTGGTWGKGSSVYTYSSGIWLWFAYSLLSEPWKNGNGDTHNKRFMGRGLIAPYVDQENNCHYPGECFYSRKDDGLPFINEEADKKAEIFGLEIRDKENYGTSYLIPDFRPDNLKSEEVVDYITEFRQKILEKWFIPVFHKKLEIIIRSESDEIDDVVIDCNYLRSVHQLKPFIEILDWREAGFIEKPLLHHELISIDMPQLKKDFVDGKEYASKESKKVRMDLGIKVFYNAEEYIDDWKIKDKIALTRNHGMIVDYHSDPLIEQLAQDYPFVAIFFGGLLSSEPENKKKQHADLFLAYSENPAHTTWCSRKDDAPRCHLDRFDAKGRKPYLRIKDLYEEINRIFKNLFGAEEPKVSSKDISSLWKKLTKIKSGGGSKGGESSFLVDILDKKNPDETGSYYWKILLKPMTKELIKIDVVPFLDSNERKISSSDFEIIGIPEFKTIQVTDENDNPIESIELNPSENKIIQIKTCKIRGVSKFKGLEPHIKLVESNDNL